MFAELAQADVDKMIPIHHRHLDQLSLNCKPYCPQWNLLG